MNGCSIMMYSLRMRVDVGFFLTIWRNHLKLVSSNISCNNTSGDGIVQSEIIS